MTRRQRQVGLILAVFGLGMVALWTQRKPVSAQRDRALVHVSLRGLDGKSVSLVDCLGKAGLMLVFTGNDCPNSNKSMPRLVELASRYEPLGFVFLGVNSNASATSEDVAAHARKYSVNFPVLLDPHHVVADLFGVKRTCEVVVLDSQGLARYHGAIDDQFGRGINRPTPTQNYLADALDAVRAGKSVELASTEAIGCPIERAERQGSTARVRPPAAEIVRALEDREGGAGTIAVGPVTFAGDVAAILQWKCQACHRAGQEAPFSLLTYEDARSQAENIREVIEDRRMPPWHADPRHGHFSNDRSLTPRERATLLAWVEQGTPSGDLAHPPQPRLFAEGWSIGQPDVVFAIPEATQVPSIGVLDYAIVLVPTHFKQDMWVESAEIRPEVRSIVHHIIVQVLPHGATRETRGEHFATYVPGDSPTRYTPGTAKRIPSGSLLKFGIHYVPDGIARSDRSKIGLVFAKTPVRHEAFTRSVENARFAIPPYASNHPIASTYTTTDDILLQSFAPHMHVRGKDFRYTATYPDGRTEILLSVPAYDFGWQSSYILAAPKAIPRGTRIDCLAHFDNSTDNPANPDPSAQVEWGEQSFEEMMIGFYDYVLNTLAEP